jgi:outer membrane protein insertion porin family/translocation and assembly module TamA
VEFNIIPGALVHLGEVAVQVQPREGTKQQIPSDVVRDLIGLKPGRLYRQDELERATRNLYQTDAYQHVKIEFVADSTRPDGDSTVGVNVQLVERYMRSARLDAGFGTLDCFRTQGAYVNRNFLHSARRLELTGRLSKIGVGAPLDSKSIRDLLCRQAKRDPYSDTLNYYAGATIRQPTLFGLRTVPDLTVYSELRSEYKAYRRVTPVGLIASLTRERFFRTPITYAYELSYGRTEASPALFCSVLNRCDPADRASFEELRRSGVLSLLVNRDRTDNPLNPTRGYYARFNFRTAHPWLLSDTAFQFNKVVGDLSRYWRVSGWSVLAARLELGTVIGKLNRTLPPQERLYGGGPNTVRGFRQNELGPSVYIVPYSDSTLIVRFDSVTTAGDSAFTLSVPATTKPQRVVPTGGNSVAVANVELRVRSPYFPNLVQFTLFTDVGEVWNRSASEPTLRFEALKVTPGLGFRVFSPVGAIRLDLGYNRYSPPPGAAYATGPEAGGSQLLCVSPGNSVAATRDSATQQFTQGSYTSCNGALDPPREPNFFKRITFFFAIGQAF